MIGLQGRRRIEDNVAHYYSNLEIGHVRQRDTLAKLRNNIVVLILIHADILRDLLYIPFSFIAFSQWSHNFVRVFRLKALNVHQDSAFPGAGVLGVVVHEVVIAPTDVVGPPIEVLPVEVAPVS